MTLVHGYSTPKASSTSQMIMCEIGCMTPILIMLLVSHFLARVVLLAGMVLLFIVLVEDKGQRRIVAGVWGLEGLLYLVHKRLGGNSNTVVVNISTQSSSPTKSSLQKGEIAALVVGAVILVVVLAFVSSRLS